MTYVHTHVALEKDKHVLTSHVSHMGQLQFCGSGSIAIPDVQIASWMFLLLLTVILLEPHEIYIEQQKLSCRKNGHRKFLNE